jgi:Spy/CpxP family protein refolding chaperone
MTKGRIMLAGVVGLAAVGALATPAQGQERHRQRGMDPEQRMERLKQELELTEDQVAAVETIFAKHDERRSEIFEIRSEDRRAMREQNREQMQALQAEVDGELAEVLTAEQMQELQELREQRRQQSRRDGGRGCHHHRKAGCPCG